MQPLALAQKVCTEYWRYIETSFPVLDEGLRKQIARKIEDDYLLWKGPQVSLSRPFMRSTTIKELVKEGVLQSATEHIFSGWHLYKHQEQATRRLVSGQPTIVASSNDNMALELAERLCGRSAPPASTLPQRLFHLLKENALLRLLEAHLTMPRSMEELVHYLEQQPARRGVDQRLLVNEITAYLLIGPVANGDDGPRLHPKVHMLFRGLEGFTRCLACRYVWEAGIDLCPHCQGRCLPVEVCRSCGQDFWRGMTHVDIDPLDDPLSKQFQMAYRLQKGSPHSYEIFPDLSRDSSSRTLRLTTELRKDAKVLDESEEDADDTDVEDEAAEQKPDTPNSAKKAARSNNTTTIATKKPRGKAREMRGISVCGHCGHATLQEPADHQCATCGNMVTRFLYQADRIIQCPACRGRYGSREIVTAFGTSVAASVAVLTSAVMRRLSEQERRLLIFSDNRQDTAFQAGYLQDKHGQFTKRQLIYQVVKEETDLGHAAVGLVDLPEMVFSRGVRLRLFEAPKRKREREEGIMLIVSPKMGQ